MYRKPLLIIGLVLLLFVAFRFYFLPQFDAKDGIFSKIESNKIAYVGDVSCKECHNGQHNEWSDSHHYKSMLPPNDSTVKGDFNNITFTADGVTSRFFKKGKKFYINTQGSDGANHDFEVKYTFGFTPLQQYLIEFPGGRLQVLRTSWDVNKKKWFNQYPGEKIPAHDWLHWTGNAQNWNTMCAYCHSTNIHKNYDSEKDVYKTSYSVVNVSCESCHGPGKKHIDFVKGGDYKSGDRIEGSYLKLPKNASQADEILVCTPCHVRAGEISSKKIDSKELLDNYIPEIPSTENFFADGQIDDEDFIYTSFMQSKMYSQGVTCSNCHNPHSTKLKKVGNQTCLQCHVPATYDVQSHTNHAVGSAGALCVSCHMPGKLYMGNDLRHDHSFRVPRPDLSVKYGTPNACSNCHKDKTEKQLASAVEKWFGTKRKYHFADDLIPGSKLDANSEKHLVQLIKQATTPNIVKATAVFYLGSIQTNSSLKTLLECLHQPDAQVRYRTLRSLNNFEYSTWINNVGPLLTDKVRAVRIAAADLYIGIPVDKIPSNWTEDFALAQKELKDYLYYQTDFSTGNVMMGDYYLKLNDYANAEKYYLKGLRKDSQMNYALLNLSTIYNSQGNNDKALLALKVAAKNDSKNDRVFYNMALLYNEMNNKVEAEKAFGKAVQLESRNSRVYYNYGLLLLEKNKFQEAVAVLEKGISISPNEPDLHYALAFVYRQSNNMTKAKQSVLKLKSLAPNNPSYQELYKAMGM
ncbi:tetratricopeptide repeat protein [Flavobacterium ovatum]|uniref:tetratricopeptide repeat protein n=1 Tax=Flavobacterium ovatum TaxID=1928857 RepID=UPI003450C280